MLRLRRDDVPANQAKGQCVVAKSVLGTGTVRRYRHPVARCADLSRIARGRFQSCSASRQIMGNRCDGSSLPRQVFIGHVLMFLARLNLIFTGGDAKYFGVTMPKEIAMTTTERAYTSPIWYTP
jgi:Protein of unknown function (DUF3604)